MENKIQKLRTLQRLEKMFPIDCDFFNQVYIHSDADYLETVSLLRRTIRLKENLPDCVPRFLYAGCVKFDRFQAPTPFVVPMDQQKNFELFLLALSEAEKTNTENTAVFHLRLLRSRIYTKYDSKPLQSILPESLELYRKEINSIARPSRPDKIVQFDEEKLNASQLLMVLGMDLFEQESKPIFLLLFT